MESIPQTERGKRESGELNLIFEISRTLDLSMDLREVVGPVLEKMATYMNMLHGTITLLDRHTGDIFIDSA